MESELLTIPQVAKRTNLGRTTIYQLIQQGQLCPVRIGRAVRIPSQVLEKWIQNQIDEAQLDLDLGE